MSNDSRPAAINRYAECANPECDHDRTIPSPGCGFRRSRGGAWGLTWVGGMLSYATESDATRAQRLYASGSVVPPKGGTADE